MLLLELADGLFLVTDGLLGLLELSLGVSPGGLGLHLPADQLGDLGRQISVK